MPLMRLVVEYWSVPRPEGCRIVYVQARLFGRGNYTIRKAFQSANRCHRILRLIKPECDNCCNIRTAKIELLKHLGVQCKFMTENMPGPANISRDTWDRWSDYQAHLKIYSTCKIRQSLGFCPILDQYMLPKIQDDSWEG